MLHAGNPNTRMRDATPVLEAEILHTCIVYARMARGTIKSNQLASDLSIVKCSEDGKNRLLYETKSHQAMEEGVQIEEDPCSTTG